MLNQLSLGNHAQRDAWVDQVAGPRPWCEIPLLGRKRLGLRTVPNIDSLLVANYRQGPLEAIVGIGKQSGTEHDRQGSSRSADRLTRSQAVRLLINLNRRDVVVDSDHLTGQTRFAHLNLLEHL